MKEQQEPNEPNMSNALGGNHMDAAIAGEFETMEPVASGSPHHTLEEPEEPASGEVLGDVVYLKNGARLPTEICIKDGSRSYKVIEKTLRDPYNPKTWYGKQETLGLGLCRKHYDNMMVARALTWAGVGVGALIVVAGLMSLNFTMILIGLLGSFAMSPVRAFFPVWAKTSNDSREVELHGVGKKFLEKVEWD